MARLTLVAVGLAAAWACVRNPLPVVPDAAPVGLEALSGSVAAEGGTGRPCGWPWYRAAPRAVGGVEAGGAGLPPMLRGLVVAEPVRCAPFDPLDYAVAAPPLPRVPAAEGGFRDPLGCLLFAGPWDRGVRAGRVVSAEAAHDAGLCARADMRAVFAADPDNRLYMAAGAAAARAKAVARGDGEWLPSRNLCWYVGAQLRVRRRYGLTVSPWEARMFEAVLRACPATAPAPRCGVREETSW